MDNWGRGKIINVGNHGVGEKWGKIAFVLLTDGEFLFT
jgi:hypothetical protein